VATIHGKKLGGFMTETLKQWVGSVVDGKFALRDFLGETDRGAVFATELTAPSYKKAAIRFVPANARTAEMQLERWQAAAQLTHPNLLSIFHSGRCKLAGYDVLYLVTEYADENLSQVLPQRPLSAAEAKEMLDPVLDVLVFLHNKEFVHGNIKPANIHAIGDQLKLSADSLLPSAESKTPLRAAGPYDPPEFATEGLTPAGDVWSLGITLVEALTQQVLGYTSPETSEQAVPDSLPVPFLEIARHALRRDPRRRWSVGEIAARLNPVVVAAPVAARAAAAGAMAVSPLRVPLSPVAPVPAAKLPPAESRPAGQRPGTRSSNTLVLPSYVLPLAAVMVLIALIVVIPKILSRRPEASTSTVAAPPRPKDQPAATKPESNTDAQAHTQKTTSPARQAPQRATEAALEPASKKEAVAAPAAEKPVGDVSSRKSVSSSGSPRGEVLDQVLPSVSEKARATIRGTVRINVRVHVDQAGNVSRAELDSPASSKYFSDAALEAARRWEFSPPDVGARSVPSEWVLHFEFKPSGTKVTPTQTSP
jgi:TonB family protein